MEGEARVGIHTIAVLFLVVLLGLLAAPPGWLMRVSSRGVSLFYLMLAVAAVTGFFENRVLTCSHHIHCCQMYNHLIIDFTGNSQ